MSPKFTTFKFTPAGFKGEVTYSVISLEYQYFTAYSVVLGDTKEYVKDAINLIDGTIQENGELEAGGEVVCNFNNANYNDIEVAIELICAHYEMESEF